MTSRPNRSVGAIRRAFTLVEMLVVIVILAIVIAIIIPAIKGARRAAKNSDTRATLAQLGNAVQLFQTDQRRLPGYFGANDMGSSQNGAANGFGFDGCSNIMLDLLGGITTQARDVPTAHDPKTAHIITVGPGNTASPQTMVNVDLTALGATTQTASGTVSKAYFSYDSKRFVAQVGTGKRMNGSGISGPNDNDLFPSLVDAFGDPILAWVKNETPAAAQFASEDSGTTAQFYWASNAGFLDTTVTSLGKQNQDQGFANGGSILSTAVPPVNRIKTLEALLGNPAAPDASTPAHPLSARGPIVFHSAGADGVFLGSQERGGKAGFVQYQANQDPFGGGPFDDVIYAAGH